MKARKPSAQQRADLRVCASCEWVYKKSEDGDGCPECQFGSYGARFVYGDNCYRYYQTQEPWLRKQVTTLECNLSVYIRAKRPEKVRLLTF